MNKAEGGACGVFHWIWSRDIYRLQRKALRHRRSAHSFQASAARGAPLPEILAADLDYDFAYLILV